MREKVDQPSSAVLVKPEMIWTTFAKSGSDHDSKKLEKQFSIVFTIKYNIDIIL